jgi:hypothetical protein
MVGWSPCLTLGIDRADYFGMGGRFMEVGTNTFYVGTRVLVAAMTPPLFEERV